MIAGPLPNAGNQYHRARPKVLKNLDSKGRDPYISTLN